MRSFPHFAPLGKDFGEKTRNSTGYEIADSRLKFTPKPPAAYHALSDTRVTSYAEPLIPMTS